MTSRVPPYYKDLINLVQESDLGEKEKKQLSDFLEKKGIGGTISGDQAKMTGVLFEVVQERIAQLVGEKGNLWVILGELRRAWPLEPEKEKTYSEFTSKLFLWMVVKKWVDLERRK